MRADDIVRQLWAVVPTLTDKFSEDLTVVSITSAGLVATVTTAVDHGLLTGAPVSISGTRAPNPIISLTQVDNVAMAETGMPHDLTQGYQGTKIDPIEIDGAVESEYNGTHNLITQVDRTHFTYEIDGDPSSPATGSPRLLEDLKYGYNGLHTITVTTPTTFTYPLSRTLGSPAVGTVVCRAKFRISRVMSTERIEESYTKQPPTDYWAFVILGQRVANKSRSTSNDSVSDPGEGASFRQFVLQPFSIYVVIPTVNSIGAGEQRDDANDLATVFVSSVVGINFDSNFNEPPYSRNVFESDNFFTYNTAYYIHEYVFQTTEYITYCDTAGIDFGVAFRDIDVSYNSDFTDEEIMTDAINLDDSAP